MLSLLENHVLPLVVVSQKISMGYFKNGVNFIPEVEYLLGKGSWKNGLVSYAMFLLVS